MPSPQTCGFMPSQAPRVRARKRASLIILLHRPRCLVIYACPLPVPVHSCAIHKRFQRCSLGQTPACCCARDRRLDAFRRPFNDEWGRSSILLYTIGNALKTESRLTLSLPRVPRVMRDGGRKTENYSPTMQCCRSSQYVHCVIIKSDRRKTQTMHIYRDKSIIQKSIQKASNSITQCRGAIRRTLTGGGGR